MKSFGIGAGAALLAAWALPTAPATRPCDGFQRTFDPPRRVTGFFDWEGDVPTAFAEHETFAFLRTNDLR